MNTYRDVSRIFGGDFMAKKITIHFNSEEQKLLDSYMEFQTAPLSTVLKAALFEDIYDFFDSMISEEAISYNKLNSKRYTAFEVLKELGINRD